MTVTRTLVCVGVVAYRSFDSNDHPARRFPEKTRVLYQIFPRLCRPNRKRAKNGGRIFYSRVIVSFHQPIHDFAGFGEGKDYALVVLGVVLGENAALAIFEPLLRRSIAADGLLPRLDRHVVEILRRVDVDAPIFPFNLVNGVISGDRETRARLGERGPARRARFRPRAGSSERRKPISPPPPATASVSSLSFLLFRLSYASRLPQAHVHRPIRGRCLCFRPAKLASRNRHGRSGTPRGRSRA